MSILQMHGFVRTLKGRMTCLLLALAIFNLNSCTVYQNTATDMNYVSSNQQILENLDIYKFYVHDQYGSYLLKNPTFTADGGISGQLNAVNYEKPDSTWNTKDRKAYWQDHKYDIGIYINETVSDLQADLDGGPVNTIVHIKGDMIEKMTIASIDKEGELATAALVVLIILGVIVVIGLMIIIITVAATASSEGADASSDGGSGSDSNSGGSDSGSGGSGSSG